MGDLRRQRWLNQKAARLHRQNANGIDLAGETPNRDDGFLIQITDSLRCSAAVAMSAAPYRSRSAVSASASEGAIATLPR
jgi:hypothetical protein